MVPDGSIDTTCRKQRLQYLFLIQRRKAWPTCWESVIRTTAAAGAEDASSEEKDKLHH
jgi:hypothetical protein